MSNEISATEILLERVFGRGTTLCSHQILILAWHGTLSHRLSTQHSHSALSTSCSAPLSGGALLIS